MGFWQLCNRATTQCANLVGCWKRGLASIRSLASAVCLPPLAARCRHVTIGPEIARNLGGACEVIPWITVVLPLCYRCTIPLFYWSRCGCSAAVGSRREAGRRPRPTPGRRPNHHWLPGAAESKLTWQHIRQHRRNDVSHIFPRPSTINSRTINRSGVYKTFTTFRSPPCFAYGSWSGMRLLLALEYCGDNTKEWVPCPIYSKR